MTPPPRKQRTLGDSVAAAGFGYWSGRDVRVEFRPAPPGAGVTFRRSDLPDSLPIAATVGNRLETPRRTTLAAGDVRVEMVEHILAALAGLQIDNCQVSVDGPEIPGCDGSSLAFVEALGRAGVVEQEAPRSRLIVAQPTRVGDEASWVEALPSPRGSLTLCYRLDYGPDNPIGRQTLRWEASPASFAAELAPARTFLLQHEAEQLRAQGLGARATYQDLLVFDDHGPIDNTLRFEDECVRHKTLDLLGDLALAGRDIVGTIVAHRSGHRLNAELVRALLDQEQAAPPCRWSA